MSEPMNFYEVYRPSIAERFWRAIGFHSRVPEMSAEGELLPGWIMTNVVVKACIRDRFRFLLCGRALVRIETRTDTMVDTAISASSFELVAPFSPQHRP